MSALAAAARHSALPGVHLTCPARNKGCESACAHAALCARSLRATPSCAQIVPPCLHLKASTITAAIRAHSERSRGRRRPLQAQTAPFAAVWLWAAGTWAPAGPPLQAHTLTVTQLAFSPCGTRLLSVSRDRSFAVYERNDDGAPPSRGPRPALPLLRLSVSPGCCPGIAL